MPKPPIIEAPVPNESIASQTWGVPVTNAVNGLTTGATLIGAICQTLAGTQTIGSSFVTVTMPPVLYDSDAFVVGNTFVVPAGLEGIYEIYWSIMLESVADAAAIRLSLTHNGTRIAQDTRQSGHNSAATLECRTTMPLAAGAIIGASAASATSSAVPVKVVTIKRIADLPVTP